MNDQNKKKKTFGNLKDELITSKTEKPNFEISYNEDLTEAYLTIVSSSFDKINFSEKDLYQIIKKENIVYGIVDDIIGTIMNDIKSSSNIKEKKYIIAKGEKPIDSIPETINIIGTQDELIIEGEIIGDKKNSIEGKFGIDVHNKRIIPKMKKSNNLRIGNNIIEQKNNDKTLYKSKITGVLFIDNEKNIVHILPEEDGRFEVNIRATGEILLTVFPPIGRKIPVNINQVIKHLDELKVSEITYPNSIERAISIGKTDKIENFLIGKGTPEDYTININVSENKMEAYIDIIRPIIPKNLLSKEEILTALHKAGVKAGFAPDDLLNVVDRVNIRRESIHNVLIAEGEEAKDGENDFIEHKVKIEDKNVEFELVGSKGIKKRGDIGEKVKQDTLICNLIKGTIRSKEGFNVLGEKILPKKGDSLEIKAGKNIRMKKEDDYKISFYSTKAGTVYIFDNTVNVFED